MSAPLLTNQPVVPMGFRFRQSVRILPGVRLNIGRRGVSLSLGGRGATITTGPRGTYGNVGIPGTGISYRTRLDSPPGQPAPQSPSTASAPRPPAPALQDISLGLEHDGRLAMRLPGGAIPSPAQCREIWNAHASSIRAWVSKQARSVDAEHAAVNTVHHDTPPADVVPVYTPAEFATPAPQPPPAPIDEAPPARPSAPRIGWIAAFSRHARQRHAEEQQARSAAYADALCAWEERRRAARDRHDAACEAHRAHLLAWTQARERHRSDECDKADAFPALVRSDPVTMRDTVRETLAALDWPLPTTCSVRVDVPQRTVVVDVDLPPMHAMPKRSARVSSDGTRLVIKELSMRALTASHARHVHGIIIRVAGFAFAVLPSVRWCIVNGFIPSHDPATGAQRRDCLVSVKVPRTAFFAIDFANISVLDPVRCVESFEHRRKMTSGGAFTPVVPFTP